MNYHQKPECCVKNCHTAAAAMSCQYRKTAAYLSKHLLSHIAAGHDGVGVNATSKLCVSAMLLLPTVQNFEQTHTKHSQSW
jgi:hypothetical protein